MALGYACLNETIKSKFFTCRLATLQKFGVDKIKQLTLDNLNVVKKTLVWNELNDISFYRMTSNIIPLATHSEFDWDWENDNDVQNLCTELKEFISEWNVRLTTHPGQFSVLNTPNENTLKNTIEDFVYHSKLMNMLGGRDMITHTGGAYGNKEEAKKRFAENYHQLDDDVRKYLRLENDDKTFTIDDVLEVHQMCGIPVVLDIHHHNCNPGQYNIRELIPHIVQTWGGFGKPKMHISTGKTSRIDPRHHDYVSEEDYFEFVDILNGHDVDIMFEAKKKELSILNLKSKGVKTG